MPEAPKRNGSSWLPKLGEVVELRRQGKTVRVGRVEQVMPDGSGFWIAAHGPDRRIFIPTDENDSEIWVCQPG